MRPLAKSSLMWLKLLLYTHRYMMLTAVFVYPTFWHELSSHSLHDNTTSTTSDLTYLCLQHRRFRLNWCKVEAAPYYSYNARITATLSLKRIALSTDLGVRGRIATLTIRGRIVELSIPTANAAQQQWLQSFKCRGLRLSAGLHEKQYIFAGGEAAGRREGYFQQLTHCVSNVIELFIGPRTAEQLNFAGREHLKPNLRGASIRL